MWHSERDGDAQIHTGYRLADRSSLWFFTDINVRTQKIGQLVKTSANGTCAQREGVIPDFTEVAVDAVQAELPLVAVVTAAFPVPAAGPVAVTRSVAMARSLRAPHTGFEKSEHRTNVKSTSNFL